MKWLLIALALAACGDDGAMMSDAGDDAPPMDEPPGCAVPSTDPPWLGAYLTETMTAIASAPRFTTQQRESARVYFTQQLERWGWTAQRQAFPAGENVFATVPSNMGTEREVIIGAHFDSVSGAPGANDNASGSAVVLSVARYLSEVPCRNAPVTVVFFDLEEAGLTGANAFAQTKTPADIAGVSTIDQVSWDNDGDRRFELEAPTSVPTLEVAWKTAAEDLGVQVTVTASEGTDHEAFRDRGFSALGLSEEYVGGDTTPFRHTPQDSLSTVDYTFLGLAARLTILATLKQI